MFHCIHVYTDLTPQSCTQKIPPSSQRWTVMRAWKREELPTHSLINLQPILRKVWPVSYPFEINLAISIWQVGPLIWHQLRVPSTFQVQSPHRKENESEMDKCTSTLFERLLSRNISEKDLRSFPFCERKTVLLRAVFVLRKILFPVGGCFKMSTNLWVGETDKRGSGQTERGEVGVGSQWLNSLFQLNSFRF